MTDRAKLVEKKDEVQFFSSGSTLLDLALGGGWVLGRVFNIVGDKSTGKTLLAIEGFANFQITFPKGRMRYAEAESAFDDAFAEVLGFPEAVTRPDKLLRTVEEFKDDLYTFASKGGPSIYILDSLDALSDDAELQKFKDHIAGKGEKGSFGVQKAKEMSELFRQLVQEMGEKDCSLGIISQIRDKIGVVFGETKTRSGGRALDFYASQVLWLAETGKIERTVGGHKRVTGVSIHSKVKKNKVGLPFREADYDLIFSYGTDDEMSMLDWLKDHKEIAKEAYDEIKKNLIAARENHNYTAINEIKNQLKEDCTRIWKDIEKKIAPPVRKYNQVNAAKV